MNSNVYQAFCVVEQILGSGDTPDPALIAIRDGQAQYVAIKRIFDEQDQAAMAQEAGLLMKATGATTALVVHDSMIADHNKGGEVTDAAVVWDLGPNEVLAVWHMMYRKSGEAYAPIELPKRFGLAPELNDENGRVGLSLLGSLIKEVKIALADKTGVDSLDETLAALRLKGWGVKSL